MDIHGHVPFARNVKILNISLSGALLETEKNPALGNSYLLKMESATTVLSVQGIVIRSTLHKQKTASKGKNIPKYTAGMHFTNLNEKKILDIARFIKDHSIVTPDHPAI